VTTVARSYDRFLSAQLSQAESTSSGLEAYEAQISRLDNLLAERESGLAAQMQKFFAGVQGVSDLPADPAARQQMLSAAQALAGKFTSVGSYLEDLNSALDEQIAGSIGRINVIGAQVASLNRQIMQLEASTGGQPPNDLMDTRDRLVADLGKIVGVTVVRQDDGAYNLFVGSGQSLVLGDRAMSMAAVPDGADPSQLAVALAPTRGEPVQLKDSDMRGGALGGVLAFRSEALASTRNAIGRIAAALAGAFNEQHAQGVDLHGAAGEDFFTSAVPKVWSDLRNHGDLALSARVTDAGLLTTADYRVTVASAGPGAPTFTVVKITGGQSVPVTAVAVAGDGSLSFDGLEVSIGGGTPAVGDSFLVQPTRYAALDFAVKVDDPALIAAAASADPAGHSADGQNALLLTALQRKAVVAAGTETLNGAYASLVSSVGNRTLEVQVARESQASLAGQVRASQQAVSGVNQDEETANLLMYQQMYQANAKVIQAASTLFDTILGIR